MPQPNKTIIFITGANSGIGFETASKLAAASPSYHIIVGARSAASGAEAVAKIRAQLGGSSSTSGTLSFQHIDLNDQPSIVAAAEAVREQHSRLDVLINNAGITSRAETFAGRLREDLATNVIGSALVTEAFEPLLLRAAADAAADSSSSAVPRLIYLSTTLGSIGARTDPNHIYAQVAVPSYRTSKAALNMLAMCYHVKYGGRAKVMAICPGFVQTNLTGKSEEARQRQADGGAVSPTVSAEFILSIVKGERDQYIGHFFDENGVIPW